MNIQKDYCKTNYYSIEDVPDFDFGEDNCNSKEIVDFNFIQTDTQNDQNTNKITETKKFIQRPICLTMDCQRQVDRAICYLTFLNTSTPSCLLCMNYFDKTTQLLVDLHKHYESRMEYLHHFLNLIHSAKSNGKFIHYINGREKIIQDMKRDIVKLSSAQIEQGYLLLNLCDARIRDFETSRDILSECSNTLCRTCDFCKVEKNPNVEKEITDQKTLVDSYVYSLQNNRKSIAERLLSMEELANKSLAASIESLDAIYQMKKEH